MANCVNIPKSVRINPADIPDDVYDMGCRIISKGIRAFYKNAENRRRYEEWMKTPEGQRANLSKEERAKFDARHREVVIA